MDDQLPSEALIDELLEKLRDVGIEPSQVVPYLPTFDGTLNEMYCPRTIPFLRENIEPLLEVRPNEIPIPTTSSDNGVVIFNSVYLKRPDNMKTLGIKIPEASAGIAYLYDKDFPNRMKDLKYFDNGETYFNTNPKLFQMSPKRQTNEDNIKLAKTTFYAGNTYSMYTSEIKFDNDVNCIVFVNQPDKTKIQCNCVQIQATTEGEGAQGETTAQGGAAPAIPQT